MTKRCLQYLFVCMLLMCLWNIKINEISDQTLEVHRIRSNTKEKSRREEGQSGWKFKTSFPVDLVYTWVNGSDPAQKKRLARFRKTYFRTNLLTATRAINLSFSRFADTGGLRYSLRSVEKCANWLRHVFIVTNGQVPKWLNLRNPRVTVVNHKEIFDNPDDLPTFSSPAIEHNIYKIRGLSDRFIYMNDDVFFGRKVSLEDFYTKQKGTKVYLENPTSTQCSRKCKIVMIKNDVCDDVCNNDHCAWDGGDCGGFPERLTPTEKNTAHLDYLTSIFYTNAVFNRAFGRRKRRYGAHGPLFIEKKVNRDMVKRFPTEVAETCRHKMRSPLDLQFGFSYLHFLMEGSNHSRRFDPRITSSSVAFLEITLNETKTRKYLNLLQKLKRKFICINDDIDYCTESRLQLRRLLLYCKNFMSQCFHTLHRSK
ncbi:N-acetylglucosamine-1-phosphotransferase subunits alpha/beta-like [Mercenaria mercenaria]|uniref:N-acetylglucosamine-1-phosphotransferase subunits alpha/beta-like n=1 Tax=Mercenaria mercenaria TaxID=6596 RepID=UPI00234EA6B7|nr:N-acetylglucosamine-1-phosphotransferase subunits alpha/beta-like [Mercenaria mercenaria]